MSRRATGWMLSVLVCLIGPRGYAAHEPVEMIQVDVQVLEVNKSKLMRLGLDWARLLEDSLGGLGTSSPVHLIEQTPVSLTRLGTFERGQVDAFVTMLQEKDYGKLLAKPKLLTLSGASASFLAGGQLPIVTQDTQGHTNVNWKEYGVKLTIKPERRVRSIRTYVRAEASTIDLVNAVQLPNGTYMPALKTRWVETDVELASKATIIIAGLIQTQKGMVKEGLPFFSDLPLLGWIFRHTRTELVETELVIFVTPSLVTQQAGTRGM